MASDELVDWVDEDDRVLGQVTRARMRAENLLHRCVAILCFDPLGRLYVHQRTAHKDVFPSLFDMTVGDLKRLNQLSSDRIGIGDRLTVRK